MPRVSTRTVTTAVAAVFLVTAIASVVDQIRKSVDDQIARWKKQATPPNK